MSTDSPLFSICIPARNRFEHVKKTIQSVINQTCNSWEIIVADNSTQDQGYLSEWVETLGLPKEKIHVLNTGGSLQMDENWEAATLPARGEYVLVVADRWRLRNGALQVFANIVEKYDPDLFFWPGTKFGQLEDMLAQPGEPHPLQISKLTTEEVFAEFLAFRGFETESVYGQAIPRALNSGYRRSLSDRARQIWGELFRPISPDYTSAMALLLLGTQCIKIHEMMYTPIPGAGSNFSNSSVIGLGHYLTTYPKCNVWRGLDEDIVFSTVLNDIEKTLNVTAQGRKWVDKINLENALKCMMSELNFKEFNGSLLPVEQMREAIFLFASQQGLSENQIASIKSYVSKSRHRFVHPRRWLRRLGVYEQVRTLNDKVRHGRNTTNSSRAVEAEDTAARILQLIV